MICHFHKPISSNYENHVSPTFLFRFCTQKFVEFFVLQFCMLCIYICIFCILLERYSKTLDIQQALQIFILFCISLFAYCFSYFASCILLLIVHIVTHFLCIFHKFHSIAYYILFLLFKYQFVQLFIFSYKFFTSCIRDTEHILFCTYCPDSGICFAYYMHMVLHFPICNKHIVRI